MNRRSCLSISLNVSSPEVRQCFYKILYMGIHTKIVGDFLADINCFIISNDDINISACNVEWKVHY
jgi:hypothetical protein